MEGSGFRVGEGTRVTEEVVDGMIRPMYLDEMFACLV
jgi:hypothetical protein